MVDASPARRTLCRGGRVPPREKRDLLVTQLRFCDTASCLRSGGSAKKGAASLYGGGVPHRALSPIEKRGLGCGGSCVYESII